MLKFLAGLVLGGILAMYPALAYPEQLHKALSEIGLASFLPNTTATPTTVAPTK